MSNSAHASGVALPSQATHTATKCRRWLTPTIILGILALVAVAFFLINNNSVNYRTMPQNLDLQVEIDGEQYYISVDEWNLLTEDEQVRCNKLGLVICYDDEDGQEQRFVTALNKENGTYTWDEAMSKFDGELPTKSQAVAMARQCKALCNAIRAFGGDEDLAGWFWTSTEYDASSAWGLYLIIGYVEGWGKNLAWCVRVVRAI